MTKESSIIARILICDDGTILHSKHQHDYVTHTDINGKEYMLDGGNGYYCRTNRNGILKVITEDNSHEEIRNWFVWGKSLDKDGNRVPFKWVYLKDIEDSHLEALVEYTDNDNYPPHVNKIFRDEKVWRE